MSVLSLLDRGYKGTEVGRGELDALYGEPATDVELLHVRPFRESRGVEIGEAFLNSLYRDPSVYSDVPQYSFELWFADGTAGFVLGATAPGDLMDEVNAKYSNSGIRSIESGALPAIEEGEYVAGARVSQGVHCAYPTKHRSVRGANTGERMEDDPFMSVLPALIGEDAQRGVVQVVFRPVKKSWYQAGRLANGDGLADRDPKKAVGYVNIRVVDIGTGDAGAYIRKQRNRPAFQVDIRVMTAGPSAEAAGAHTKAITSAFDVYTNPTTQQELDIELLSGSGLRRELVAVRDRRLSSGRGFTKRLLYGPDRVWTDSELGELVHLPARSDVDLPDVDYTTMESGPGVSADASKPPVDRATALPGDRLALDQAGDEDDDNGAGTQANAW